MAEIPAETAYLASSPNNAVCKGWVVVQAVQSEPVSGRISLRNEINGIAPKFPGNPSRESFAGSREWGACGLPAWGTLCRW